MYQPRRPTQPSTLSGMGNEYLPKGCEALRLESKDKISGMLWHIAAKTTHHAYGTA